MKPATGRTVTVNQNWEAWVEEAGKPVLTFDAKFGAMIFSGSPFDPLDEGAATLWWSDGVANEWAETYSDLPTAMARLAALEQAVERDEGFRDSAEGFTRWSDQFFERTVSNSIIPTTKAGEDT